MTTDHAAGGPDRPARVQKLPELLDAIRAALSLAVGTGELNSSGS